MAKPADPRRFARVHRVRDVQARLAQAEEARADAKVAAEVNLAQRIARLAADVAPAPVAASAMSLAATAHFRDRLHASATSARARVDAAEAFAERTRAATQAALRDRTAAEKLLDRARAAAAIAAARAEPDAPDRPRDRHDPC